MADNTQVILVEKPAGKLKESHFEIQQSPLPTPDDGQLLVRNVLLPRTRPTVPGCRAPPTAPR